jgi:hypothetical protein
MGINDKNRPLKRDVFESNAAQLRELHNAIQAAYARRIEGDVQWKAWQEVCRRFHSSYDALAFPGGLGNAMSLLAKRDPTAIEMVVRFLEADPWYFRSGYHKEYMIKELRKIPLTEEQRKRLQQVILARIQEPKTPLGFRRYCRLARFVSDDGFERHVADLVEPSGSVRARHAQWVLAQIRSGRDRLAPR